MLITKAGSFLLLVLLVSKCLQASTDLIFSVTVDSSTVMFWHDGYWYNNWYNWCHGR